MEIIREPYRICYASSYDRGLEELLNMWGDIKKEVPEAALHIYYGWNTYDNFIKKGLLKDDGFKQRMELLFQQDGVFEHGRLGHRELIKEYYKAKVFAYPCKYTGEINCLALSKAIACGCICVTNDFGVMSERNPHFVVPNEKFKHTLISVLKGKYKRNETDAKLYLEENSWKKVAESWDKDIL